MIASVLHLSRDDCKKLKIMDVYSIHKIVYSLFPQQENKARNFLFCDKGGDFYERRILILSEEIPLQPEIGMLESKNIPKSFLYDDYYGFTVLMNPVKKESKTGKIIVIKGKENMASWFIQKSEKFGFEILPDSLVVNDTTVLKFEKKGQKVVLSKAQFIGKLKVTNRELFIKSFKKGLGKGKAFGFGLFQIVPIEPASVDA